MIREQRNQLSLFLKAAVFGLILWFVGVRDFQLIPVLFFALAAIFIYSRPLFESLYIWYGFLVLVPAAILGMKILVGSVSVLPPPLASLAFGGGVVLFSFIFYILLGIKNYLLVKRSRAYFVAAILLFYCLFIIFFLADKSEWFLGKYGLIALASFLLFREWLALIPSFYFPQRELLASVVAALIITQFLWAVALLPIGFISSANLMLLFTFGLADFLLKHFTGGISKEFLAQHLVFFVLLGALIFWTSSWSLSL